MQATEALESGVRRQYLAVGGRDDLGRGTIVRIPLALAGWRFIAIGAALLGVAGGFDAASNVPCSFWTSVPVIVAYVIFGLSLACFTGAIREAPIPHPISRRSTRVMARAGRRV